MKTIDSVKNQSSLPLEWIIINDGSTDGSTEILVEISKQHEWIKVFQAPDLTRVDYSSRVIDLFNYGFKQLSRQTDLICKLDADVSFASDFFEQITQQFHFNSKLAVASGHLHINGIPEQIDKNQLVCTRGATKVYRLAFLEEIGGLVSYQGWDTLDNVAARAKGWEAKIVNVPFEHLKTEGARVGNFVYRHVRNGFYNGTIPFYFPYFLIKIGVKLFKTPLIISSLLMLWGYCKARIIGVKSPYPMYMVSRLRYEQKSFLLKKLKL